jgi:leucine dehydrogenase
METRIFEELGRRGHDSLFFAADPDSGMRAIIGIHSTVLGPALGGTRIRDYDSVDAALIDVLRLSRAMTYKAAAAHLPLGGGKAVILGDPAVIKTEALLEAYGRAVESLGGSYVTAEDVGSTVEDMAVVARRTAHVTGLPVAAGGSGDPSPATAHGVRWAMRATAEHLWGTTDLDGRKVAIQGVGKVGTTLATLLVEEGCEVVVADVDQIAVEKLVAKTAVEVVPAERILFEECDILAPCALGAVLNPDTIPLLACRAVVGAANNQLLDPENCDALADVGIVYTPDFIANAGGIINIVEELKPEGYSWDRSLRSLERIFTTTGRVLTGARDSSSSTLEVAVEYAERRLAEAGGSM